MKEWNFKDTLSISIWNKLTMFNKRRTLNKLCFIHSRNCLQNISIIRGLIADADKQIAIWNNILPNQNSISHANIQKSITLYEAIVDFLKIEVYVYLLEADFYTAHKHLMLATDDWEARFFARRCYTLIYETSQSIGHVSKVAITKLKNLIEDKNIKGYNQAKKKLTKFVGMNKRLLKLVRNKSESHKPANIEEQIEALESVSIKEAYSLSSEFISHLINLTLYSRSINENIRGVLLDYSIKSLRVL